MAPAEPRANSSSRYIPPSPPKMGMSSPTSLRMAEILGGVGGSSSFKYWTAGTLLRSLAMKSGDMWTPEVLG